MGDQSNAPERIKVQAAATGWENVEMVAAEAYGRAITERDEARRDFHAAERNECFYRSAIERAVETWAGSAAAPTLADAAVVMSSAINHLRAALAEGEQPAGERATIGEVERERIVEIVRKVAMAVALGSDPDELRDAVEQTIEWATVQRAAMVSAGKAMGEIEGDGDVRGDE